MRRPVNRVKEFRVAAHRKRCAKRVGCKGRAGDGRDAAAHRIKLIGVDAASERPGAGAFSLYAEA